MFAFDPEPMVALSSAPHMWTLLCTTTTVKRDENIVIFSAITTSFMTNLFIHFFQCFLPNVTISYTLILFVKLMSVAALVHLFLRDSYTIQLKLMSAVGKG